MKKYFLILGAVLLFFSTATAQETSNGKMKLSVTDAISLASENNISLKRQKISLEVLEKKNKTSWNSISPSASISGSYGSNFTEPTSQSWSVSGSLSLSLTPSLYTSIQGAKLNYENGLISYEEAKRSIELNVRKAFYSLILAKENLSLQERNLETARQSYISNRDKFNRGQLSELNLLNSQYSYESQKPSLESAQINYENDLGTFKQMIGLDQSTQIELDGSLNDYLNLKEINIEKEIEELPSVQSLKRQIKMAENNLLATRFSAWGPSVSTSYSYGQSGTVGNDTTRETNSLSLNVRIPLDGYLPWSSGSMSIASQKATLEDLQLQLENQKTTAALAIQNSLKKIKQVQSLLAANQTNINLAQRKYNATLTAYNHGSADFLTLQNASDSLLSARTSRQSQLFTLISTILELENTLGIPFGTLGK